MRLTLDSLWGPWSEKMNHTRSAQWVVTTWWHMLWDMFIPICDVCGANLISSDDSRLSSLACGHVFHDTCIRHHVSTHYDCFSCHCPASATSVSTVKISAKQNGTSILIMIFFTTFVLNLFFLRYPWLWEPEFCCSGCSTNQIWWSYQGKQRTEKRNWETETWHWKWFNSV